MAVTRRTEHASRLLYVSLISLTLGATAILVALYQWKFDQTARDQFVGEGAKALLQVLTVAIVGGLIKVLVDDQQRLQREENDERQRLLRDAADARLREEANEARLEAFRTDKVRRLVGVTNALRKAPILIDAHRSAKTYNEQMRGIVDAGLELRLIRHETDAIGPDRNPAFKDWPAIRDAIRQMEEYVAWIVRDFRSHSKALSESQRRAEVNREQQAGVWEAILSLESVHDLLAEVDTRGHATRYATEYLGAHETALRLMIRSSIREQSDSKPKDVAPK